MSPLFLPCSPSLLDTGSAAVPDSLILLGQGGILAIYHVPVSIPAHSGEGVASRGMNCQLYPPEGKSLLSGPLASQGDGTRLCVAGRDAARGTDGRLGACRCPGAQGCQG